MNGTGESLRARRFLRKTPDIAACLRLLKKRREQVYAFFAMFLIALARCFGLPSPYAVCCIAAMAFVGVPLGGAVAGAAFASLYLMLFGQPPDFAQAFACLMLLLLPKIGIKSKKTLIVCVTLMLLMRGAVIAAESFVPQKLVMALVSAALGGVAVPSAVRAAEWLFLGKKDLTAEDVTCLVLPAMAALSGLSALSVMAFNPGYAAAFLIVLTLAFLFGSPVAACAGAAAGFALMLGGHGALLPVLLTVGGACCGLLRGRMRALPALLSLAVALLMMYLLLGQVFASVILSAAAGGIAFLMLPNAVLKRIKRALGALWRREAGDNAYMKLRVRQWARDIEGMIGALPEPSIAEPDAETLCEELAGRLCEGCDRMPVCWHEEYDRSKRAAMHVIEASGDDERLIECVNLHYGSCRRIAQIPGIAARFEAERQGRLRRTLNAGYEKQMLSTHLSAMSEAIQLIALEDGAEASEEAEEWLAAVHDALNAMKFPAKIRFVRKIDERFTVCLDTEPLAPHVCAGDEIAHAIGIRLGACMEVTERRVGQVLLRQQPPSKLCVGMATSCAVTPERMNLTYSVENGDAVTHGELTDGRALVALSDGMGHGEAAKKESRKTLELLTNCLRAGYSRTQAITAVNGMMLSATGGEQFATVDLFLFDPWTGEATLDKLGACASYIVRGQKVQEIEGAALPLGVIAHVIPTEYSFSFACGDTVVMLSDGASDVFGEKEEWMKTLSRYLNEPSQRMADALLQDALVRVNGMPADDMTVVCIRAEDQDGFEHIKHTAF